MQNRPVFQRGGLLASRIAGLLVGIVTAVWLIVSALDRANVEDPAITLEMARWLPGWIDARRKAGNAPILALGDSTVVSYPPGRQVRSG
jgi:predicted exporter